MNFNTIHVSCLLLIISAFVQGKRRLNGERLRCNFEEDMCRIKQDKSDDGRWIRLTGTNIVENHQLPATDHTYNTDDVGFYMYAYSTGTSRLLTPVYPSVLEDGPKCLTFWYSIFGSRRHGTLSVYQSYNESYFGEPIWEITGHMGSVWRSIELDLTSTDDFQIVFEANRPLGYGISIAVDDVLISDKVCPGLYSNDPRISCNFEDEELCGYVQDLSDDIDWKRYNAEEGVSGDGPDEDHTYGEEFGFYLCMDQHRVPKLPGHRARITSPVFNTTFDSDHCVIFWYFLSGYDVGEINAYTIHGNVTELVFTVGDGQNDVWQRASFQIPSNINSFQLMLESIRGQSDGMYCIDDVKVSTGSCSDILRTTTAPSTSAPTEIPLVVAANCDFETDCHYVAMGTHIISNTWILSTGILSQLYRRFPSKDHTLGTIEGRYMHISRQVEYNVDERIRLRTPWMYKNNATICLQFYLCMNDQSSDAHLNVYVDDSALVGLPIDPISSVYNSYNSEWKRTEILIEPTVGNFSVLFEAISGGSRYQEIAIDDVIFFEHGCPTVTATKAPTWISTIDCDFESDEVCGYEQRVTSANWTRYSGPTNSKITGPQNDHTYSTTKGHYMYMEASPPRRRGNTANLQSPLMHPIDGPMCFQFWYNMHGEDVGSLTVYRNSPFVNLWHKEGNAGTEWKLAQLLVNVVSYGGDGSVTYVDQDFSVTFTGSVGKGYRGDIAIDDIKLLPQSCSPPIDNIECDMETGIEHCGFTVESNSREIWRYFNYKYPDIPTGSFIPTELSSNVPNSFVYCSRPRYRTHVIMKTPTMTPASSHCLSFSYIISRHTRITISTALATGQMSQIKYLSKQQAPLWTSVSVQFALNSNETFQVFFEADVSLDLHSFAAIDDVKITQGNCPEPVAVEKLTCYFEKDCGFIVDDTEKYVWQLSNTPTNRKLPTYDHTLGTPSGNFFYITRDYLLERHQRNFLRTPAIRQTGSKRCLQFYYYLNSDSNTMLYVYAEEVSRGSIPVDPIWEAVGVKGPRWVKASVDILPAKDDFTVVFEPVLGGLQGASIAIDDVMVLKQKCSKVYQPEWISPIDCDFERNRCGFSVGKVQSSNFEWRRNTGATKTLESGPTNDHTFEDSEDMQGNYMYIETSPPRVRGDYAILASPLILSINTSMCLEFWYSMYGQDVGSLEVYLSTPATYGYTIMWQKHGQQSKRWLKAEIHLDVTLLQYTTMIHFKGIVGFGYKGDIAIDDVQLTSRSCQRPPKNIDPPPVNETLCDFENGAKDCGFDDVADEGSGTEWNYFNVSTLTVDPTLEYTDIKVIMSKGQRSFIFADASDIRAGEHVVIMTPDLFPGQDHCLMFSYVTMGDFIINIYSKLASDKEEFIHQLTGEYLSGWTSTSVDIPPQTYTFKVVFEGVIGRDDEGFLALDDIHVQSNKCYTETPLTPTDLSAVGVVDDLRDKTSQDEDRSSSAVTTVVIALLTIGLLIVFVVAVFLVLTLKRNKHKSNACVESETSDKEFHKE